MNNTVNKLILGIYIYISGSKLYRKRKIKTLHYRTVSKGPGGPLSSGAWNID